MTAIRKDGYTFLVDIPKTSAYYAAHSLCDCDACRNFYEQIHGKYPDLEAFLSSLGADIAKPDETPWWDTEEEISYNPCYTVTGTVETMGEYELDFGSIQVTVSRADTPFSDIPNEQTEPYFVLAVYNISLPWVLDTPFPAAPKREPFWRRLTKWRDLFSRDSRSAITNSHSYYDR